jgi:hypothetical protein
MSVTFCRTLAAGAAPAAGRARAREGAGLDDAAVAAALGAGLLPVETARAESPVPAWAVEPAVAMELLGRGVAGWRITVRRSDDRAAVLDALVRTGAAFLRTDPAGIEEAIELCWLPGIAARVSVAVADLGGALDAIAAGATDLVVGDWDADQVAALREALAPRALLERTALPPGTEIDDARADLARPLFTAWLAQIDGSGLARPRYRWAPGRDEEPPVPARRLSAEWEDAGWRAGAPDEDLGRLDPDLAGILTRSLEGTPPRVAEIERLFRARGAEVEAVARVADALRARRVGEVVTYVINRNINYTNQCYFRCGFCGFSRGPKSLNLRGDPYILNVHEVVHRRSRRPSVGPPRSACRASSTPTSPATSTSACSRRSSSACPRCTCTASRRSRSGRAPARSASRCASSSPACATPASAPCRGLPPRSSTTACASTCARTRCARPSGPR